MIRTFKVLFCEEDHGTGDRMFPDTFDIDPRMIVEGAMTTRQLRKMAKAAGWTYSQGADYCETCSASVNDPLNNATGAL
jgi:hypothetical protein